MDLEFGAFDFNTGDEWAENSRRDVYQQYIKQC